jgi:hypothetical protein
VASLNDRFVFPQQEDIASLEALNIDLPDHPTDPFEVLTELHTHGSPAQLCYAITEAATI